MNKISRRTQQMREMFDATAFYGFKDALKTLRKFESLRKFKQGIELSISLKEAKKKKGSSVVNRFVFTVSHGLPQDLKILAVVNSTMEKQLRDDNKFANLHLGGEEAILKIAQDRKTDYNMIVCTPDMFAKFAKHAAILGPMKLMPSAKTGTVLENIMSGVRDLLLGTKLKVKKDKNVLRMKIANADFSDLEIEENFNSVMSDLIEEIKQKDMVKSVRMKLSMSPSVNILY
jgi:large subunit ribosomal protein L1